MVANFFLYGIVGKLVIPNQKGIMPVTYISVSTTEMVMGKRRVSWFNNISFSGNQALVVRELIVPGSRVMLWGNLRVLPVGRSEKVYFNANRFIVVAKTEAQTEETLYARDMEAFNDEVAYDSPLGLPEID